MSISIIGFVLLLIIGSFLVSANYQLKGIQPNGSSLSFSWKSEAFSIGIPNHEKTKLYAPIWKADGNYVMIMDIENFANVTTSTVKANPNSTTLSGVINDYIGFTSKLVLLSLRNDLEMNYPALISDSAITSYGPLKNSIIAITNSAIILYVYKQNEGLIELFKTETTIIHSIVSRYLILCGNKYFFLYMITTKYSNYYLTKFNYFTGEIVAEVMLSEYTNSLSNCILLSSTESYITVYYNNKISFYKIKEETFELITRQSMQLSAITTLPHGNNLIAKSDSSTDVYIISMANGNILEKMMIEEKEYFAHIYTRFYGEENTVLFTDFINWYAYKIEVAKEDDTKSLVNAYVILMSVFLVLAMMISVIYILNSRNDNVPASSQNESQIQMADQRSQVMAGRASDNHLFTDLTETKINLLGTEIYRRMLFVCPLTGMIMKDPVVAADGYTYERNAIKQWFEQNSISPTTHEPIPNKELIPNNTVANCIHKSRNTRNEG